MSRHGRRPLRSVIARLVGLVGLIGLSAGVLLAPPAQAHTELSAGSPGRGERLREAPQIVRLVFSDVVAADLATVVVRGPNGENLAQGVARGTDGTLIQPVAESAESGRFEVAYRVVSADGHPVSGSYTFRVRQPRPEPAATPSEPATPTPSDPAPSDPAPAPSAPAPSDPAPSAPATAPAVVTNPPIDRSGTASLSSGPAMGAGAVVLVIAAGALLARRRRVRETSSAPPGP